MGPGPGSPGPATSSYLEYLIRSLRDDHNSLRERVRKLESYIDECEFRKAEAVAKEREECARLCAEADPSWIHEDPGAMLAAAIRRRQ